MLLEFLFGVLIGHVYVKRGMISVRAGTVLLIAGIALLCASEVPTIHALPRVIKWGLPSILLVIAVLELDHWFINMKVMKALGDASYSIYLSHTLTLAFLGAIWSWSGIEVPLFGEVALMICAMITSVIFGVFGYLLFERPMAGILRSQSRWNHAQPQQNSQHIQQG